MPATVYRYLVNLPNVRGVGHEVIELRQVLPPHASDFEALEYAREHGLFLITCNRDDFLALAGDHPNPGIIILVRRRSRQICPNCPNEGRDLVRCFYLLSRQCPPHHSPKSTRKRKAEISKS